MGPMEISSQYSEKIKMSTARYAFGANFIDPNAMLNQRVLTDGRLIAIRTCDLTDSLTVKANPSLQMNLMCQMAWSILITRVRTTGLNFDWEMVPYLDLVTFRFL